MYLVEPLRVFTQRKEKMKGCHDCEYNDVCMSPQGTCENYEHKSGPYVEKFYAPSYIITRDGSIYDPIRDEFVYDIDKPIEK